MAIIAKYKEKLLNEFESRSDNWSFGEFEKRLGEIRKGTSYHDAKGIIIEAHKSGLWPNTVKRYLITNYKSFGSVSMEFSQVFREIYSSMSSKEKQSWGIE